jgi:hypothetical protein
MAQETRIAPIEFDRTPTQVMLNIAEQQQQDALKRQQVEFERAKYMRSLQDDEMKRRYENAKTFSSELQNNNWINESRDEYMKQGLDILSSLKDIDSSEGRVKAAKFLTGVAQDSSARKAVYDRVDAFISSLPPERKAGFSADVFKNRALKTVLFNPDGTKKSLEQLQLDNSEDALEKIYQNNLKDLYDVSAGYKQLSELIKAPENSKIPLGSKNVEFNPELQVLDGKKEEVKLRTDPFGYIDNDVYKKFTSFPTVDAMYTRKAEEFINNYNSATKEQRLALLRTNPSIDKNGDGIPDEVEKLDIDLIKKGFMTQDLKRELPNISNQPSKGVTINVGNTGPGLEKGRIPAFKTLVSTLEGGEDPMSSTKIDNNIKNAILTIADENSVMRVAGKKLSPSMIEVKKADDGSVGIYMKGSGKLITSLSEQSFDMRVNEALGGKAVGAAAGQGNPKPSGLTYKGIDIRTGKPIFE